jgi:hypothetical protein
MTTQQLESYLEGRKISVGTYLWEVCNFKDARVKITSIHIWKKQKCPFEKDISRFRIGWKYGLYVFGEICSFQILHTNWLSNFEKNAHYDYRSRKK